MRVHAHIIHQHTLRKDRGVVRIAGKIAADCEVQYHEERMVIHPACAGRKIGWRLSRVKVSTYVETHGLGPPLQSKDVEVMAELTAWQMVDGHQAVLSG